MCVAAETVCTRSFFEILKPSKEPLLIIERLEAIKLQLYVLVQVPRRKY